MFEEHERFMGSFGDTPGPCCRIGRTGWSKIACGWIATCRRWTMSSGVPDPDRNRIRAEAREVKRAMSAWQRHYRQLGHDIGVTAG